MSSIEPLVVPFADFCRMIGVKATKGHELIKSKAVESYLDGSRRMVVVESIKKHVERMRRDGSGKREVKSARRAKPIGGASR